MRALLKTGYTRAEQDLAAGLPAREEAPREAVVVERAQRIAPKTLAAGTAETTATNAGQRNLIRYSLNRFRENMPHYTIGSVSFNFMSPVFIRKKSVVQCDSSAVDGPLSVNSPLMGSINQSEPCATCKRLGIDCPGHPGHIELPVLLPHPLARNFIVYVLQSVCRNCGRLVLPEIMRRNPKITRLRGEQRLKEIDNIVRSSGSIICPRNLELASSGKPVDGNEQLCSSELVEYSHPNKDIGDWKIFARSKKRKGERERPVPMKEILEIFEAIPNEDLAVMGFNGDSHPKNFIMSVLPVLSQRKRPPIIKDGERKEDVITTIYRSIVKSTNIVSSFLAQKEMGALSVENRLSEAVNKLFMQISQLIDNSDRSYTVVRNDPAKTIGPRLSGKDGLCRAATQGKRVNNSARSVIGPGIVSFGSIVLPSAMRIVTVMERVNRYNLARVQREADTGRIVHIARGSGKLRGIKMRLPRLMMDAAARGEPFDPIAVGDVVHRIAQNGEHVFVNRQPTLHRHSLIGCRAVYRALRNTINLHMAYTPPMNADFDGDESNINVPQTNRAKAEIAHLIGAKNQLVYSANSEPTMGLVFNCPTSAYLTGRDDDRTGGAPFVSAEEWRAVASALLVDDAYFATLPARLAAAGVREGSPRAIMSLVFPPDFYYTSVYEDIHPDGTEVKVQTRIEHGVFVAGVLGKYDIKTGGIMHRLHMRYGADVAGRFLTEGQFVLDWYIERRGFSIGLSDMLLADRATARDIMKQKMENILLLISKIVNDSKKVFISTETELRFRDDQINSTLRSIQNVSKKLISGNIAGVGNPTGVMIMAGAKGSLENILQISGALGQQFIMGSRPERSLVYDDAHEARTLPYFELDDDSVQARGFVARSFADGVSPAGFMFHSAASRLGLLDTAMKTADTGTISKRMQKVLENNFLDYSGAVVNSSSVFASLSYGEGYSPMEMVMVRGFSSVASMYMPFNARVMENELAEEFGGARRPLSAAEIEECVARIPPVPAAVGAVARHNHEEIREVARLQLAEIAVPGAAVAKLAATIHNRCRRAHVHYGEAVGFHAAEAVAQPIMQATLNSFHKTGAADTGNMGVSSFAEILNLSKNRKVPQVRIHFRDDEMLRNQVEKLSIAFRAVSVKRLLADPIEGIMVGTVGARATGAPIAPGAHYALFEAVFAPRERPWATPGAYYTRLSLSAYKLFEARITTEDVAREIEAGGGVICVWSPTIDGVVDVYARNILSPEIFRARARAAERAGEEDIVGELERLRGIRPDNAALVYMQVALIPRITEDLVFAHSRVAARLMHDLAGEEYVPFKSRHLSLFKEVVVKSVSTLDIVRNATAASPRSADGAAKEWKLWIDAEKTIDHGIPRSKVIKLCRVVFGDALADAASNVADAPIERVVPGGDFVRLAFHKARTSPLSALEDAVAADHAAWRNADFAESAHTPVTRAARYVYIVGVHRIERALSRVLAHPAINPATTTSNEFEEMNAVFGIEVVRAMIMREMYAMISGMGSTINPRHVQLIVDVMVSTGSLMPFTARGSLRMELGAFSESSFERAVTAFTRSAIIGRSESVSATSTSILMGTVPPFGTGSFRLVPEGDAANICLPRRERFSRSEIEAAGVRTLSGAPGTVDSGAPVAARDEKSCVLLSSNSTDVVGTLETPPAQLVPAHAAPSPLLSFARLAFPPRAPIGVLSTRKALAVG